MKIRKISAVVCACIALALVIYLSVEIYRLPPSSASSHLAEMTEDHWRARVALAGPRSAYAEFETFVKEHPKIQHALSHLFGGALYKEVGAAGLSVCDFAYQSGCLHEFFRQIIPDKGLDSLSEMREECERAKGRGLCVHAMGHGVLSYLGYSKKDLVRALEICSESLPGDPMFGCSGGVFMEYNGYMLLDDSSRPKSVTMQNRYDTCIGIPTTHERSCVWWLVRWWTEHLQHAEADAEVRFKKIGQWCVDLPGSLAHYRRECFEHTGQAIASMGWNIDLIKRLCVAASHSEADELFCRSYAASMFIVSDAENPPLFSVMVSDKELSTQTRARELCSDLSPAAKTFCEEYANNKRYVDNELPLPF